MDSGPGRGQPQVLAAASPPGNGCDLGLGEWTARGELEIDRANQGCKGIDGACSLGIQLLPRDHQHPQPGPDRIFRPRPAQKRFVETQHGTRDEFGVDGVVLGSPTTRRTVWQGLHDLETLDGRCSPEGGPVGTDPLDDQERPAFLAST